MMSYLAMSTQFGIWVAPMFVAFCMVLIMPFVSKAWFRKYAIVAIAAGSVGGMVGTCLGLTWPSFYFLHRHGFEQMMHTPVIFAINISLFVFFAGICALIKAFSLKDKLVTRLPFPMSQLIHDIVYIDDVKSNQKMMVHGVLVSSAWNIFLRAQQVVLQPYSTMFHMIPMLISLGFIAGQYSAISLLIGMCIRQFALIGLKAHFFANVAQQEFIIFFCLGIFLALIVMQVVLYIWSNFSKLFNIVIQSSVVWRLATKRKFFIVGSLIVGVIAFLLSWHVNILVQIYMFMMLGFIAYYVSLIAGKSGTVDLPIFIWMFVFPLLFVCHGIGVLSFIVFSMIYVGVVLDSLFSYKLAELSDISYERIMKYQIVGFLTAVVSVGFIMWWYFHTFTLGSDILKAQSAQDFDFMLTMNVADVFHYHYQIIICGFLCGLVIKKMFKDPLVVVAAILMSNMITMWSVIAGALSLFVKNRETYYPFWFGVYASHALWMVLQVLV